MDATQKPITKVVRPRKGQAPHAVLPDTDAISNAKAEARAKRMHDHQSLTDRLADHALDFRNWMYPDARESFPYHPEMRVVDHWYPMAKKPIAIDTPDTPAQMIRCLEQKAPVLAKLGIRYYVVDRKKSVEEMMAEVELLP